MDFRQSSAADVMPVFELAQDERNSPVRLMYFSLLMISKLCMEDNLILIAGVHLMTYHKR